MANKKNTRSGRIARVADSVKRLFTHKHDESEQRVAKSSGRDDIAKPIPTESERPHQSRPIRRETDVTLEQLDQSYSPTQTSLKGPFRASGADQQRDQEFSSGAADERWNNEDHFTNKSGDPRIGTHRRSYEPGERDTLIDEKA